MVIDDTYRAQITGLGERRAKITSPLTLMSLKTTIIGKRPYETIQIQFSEKVKELHANVKVWGKMIHSELNHSTS